jgi:hypothetical protein
MLSGWDYRSDKVPVISPLLLAVGRNRFLVPIRICCSTTLTPGQSRIFSYAMAKFMVSKTFANVFSAFRLDPFVLYASLFGRIHSPGFGEMAEWLKAAVC